nr:VanZ family protein [uncultured Anaerostipes sp.]
MIGVINLFLFPSMLVAIFIWGMWAFCFYLKKRNLNLKLWGIRYVFITYISSVFIVTDAYKIFTEGFPMFFMEPNFIPFFNTIKDILANPLESIGQIAYNFILFIPFGFLIVFSFPNYKWKLMKIIVISFIVVFVVETLEYFSGRYMDIDDIIINICGSVLGYGIGSMLNRVRYHYKEKCI